MIGRPYTQAIEYLYGLAPRGMRLELGRVRRALGLRGDPHLCRRCVHVAGTNGKGSVASMIASGLSAGGHRTGLYTSPHLHRFVERIRVDGRPVREAEVAARVADIRRTLARPHAPELTFFEVTTILAFEVFRDAGCDAVVLEVGLGGRLDATNVVRRHVSVITQIGVDHAARLGSEPKRVAREKAGIIERGVPVIAAPGGAAAERVIRARARRLRAPLLLWGQDFGASPARARGRVDAWVGARRFAGLRQPLSGAHQVTNVATAVAALTVLEERGYRPAFREGLSRVRWPGRLERIGAVLLDAAHNPDGCRALAAHLDELGHHGPIVLLFGAMEDKDHEGMLAAFDGRAHRRIYATPAMPRAATPGAFVAIRSGTVARSVRDGLARARRAAGANGLVVVAGSIFLMAEVRALLRGVRCDPPIGM